MYRFIIGTSVVLAAAHLIGLPLNSLIVWVVAFFLLAIGFRWLLTQKLPPGVGRTLVALLLGAPVLVILLNMAYNFLRQAEPWLGALSILMGVLLAAWLVPKIWRGQKRFKL
jgi:hypothetical protein